MDETATDLRALAASGERDACVLVQELIRRPSENPPGDERAVVERARAALEDIPGVELRVVEPAPDRVSLIAASGPLGRRTLLLGVHLDTVPAADGWSRDPFGGELVDGTIHGRGATDNKGAAGAAIVAFRTLVEQGATTDARLLLVLNADEEIGGALGMDHVRDALGEPVDAALIAEPSGIDEPYQRLWVAARGWIRFEIEASGTQTHTSMMRQPGVRSALADLLAVIDALRARLPLLERDDPSGYPAGELILSRLEGGRDFGLVPAHARAKLELRLTPGPSRDEIAQLLRDAFEDARRATGAVAELTFPAGGRDWTSPSSIDADHPLVEAAKTAWRDVLGREPQLGCFAGGTDARSLAERGIPSIPGIGPGTLLRCHTPDEFVTVEEISTAIQLYVLTAWGYLRGGAP